MFPWILGALGVFFLVLRFPDSAFFFIVCPTNGFGADRLRVLLLLAISEDFSNLSRRRGLKTFFQIFLMVFRVDLITTVTYPTLWVMIEVGHGARVIYYNSDRMCSIT